MTGTPAVGHRELLRRFYDQSAPSYDLWMDVYDRVMLDGARQRICSRARGQTLELAIGTGRNLAFYPHEVRLIGVDISPGMLAVARERAQLLGRHVELRLGDAEALEFADGSFDTVVSTLFFGSVPDCARAAAEAWRVLKWDGQLLLLETVESSFGPVRWAQRLIAPLAVRFTGDHLLRDPTDFLGGAGFNILRCDRFRWGVVEELIARRR